MLVKHIRNAKGKIQATVVAIAPGKIGFAVCRKNEKNNQVFNKHYATRLAAIRAGSTGLVLVPDADSLRAIYTKVLEDWQDINARLWFNPNAFGNTYNKVMRKVFAKEAIATKYPKLLFHYLDTGKLPEIPEVTFISENEIPNRTFWVRDNSTIQESFYRTTLKEEIFDAIDELEERAKKYFKEVK